MARRTGAETTDYTAADMLRFMGVRVRKQADAYSPAYERDFGWMGTYDEFCRARGIGALRKGWGVRAWMVREDGGRVKGKKGE